MYCKNCGQKLSEGAKFCTSCGYKMTSDKEIEPSKSLNDGFEKINNSSNNSKVKTSKAKGFKVGIIITAVLVILIVAAGIATDWAAPLRAKYYISQGSKYIAGGKFEEAIPVLERANSIDENNIDSRLKLAESYINADEKDKAKDLLKETLKLDKTHQDAYVMLADIYEKEKNNVELIKLLNEGLAQSKEKGKLQTRFDKLLAEINISDINASVEMDGKYELPKLAQLQIGEDKFELPIDWKAANVDTSNAGNQSLEGTIKYINKPINLKLDIIIKPALVTEDKSTKDEASYEADFSVPVISMEGKYSGNAAALNELIQKDINKYETENIKSAQEALNDGYIAIDGKYQFNISYNVAYNKNGLISIVLTYYTYTGGAHGMGMKTAYNYDLVQGKVLNLQDLFSKDVNATDVVKEEVVKQMQTQTDMFFQDSIDSVKSYSQPFQFYFTEQGVVVYFSEYEIGPYAIGMPEFTITKDVAIK